MRYIILILLLLCLGCNKRHTFTQSQRSDSTYTKVIEREKLVTVPGATIYNSVNLDSLAAKIKPTKSNPIIIRDTSGRAELRYWIDAAGKLRQECEAKDTTISYIQKELSQIRQMVSESSKHEVKKVRPWELYGLLVALTLIILLLLIRR
jgi:hypothetical protein